MIRFGWRGAVIDRRSTALLASVPRLVAQRRLVHSISSLDCIVGIETSCDDTGVSVIGFHRDAAAKPVTAGAVVLADALASQAALHAPFAGVVPHFAARAHEANLPIVLERALAAAGVGGNGRRVVAVAVTVGP